jgi:hypothetical protein
MSQLPSLTPKRGRRFPAELTFFNFLAYFVCALEDKALGAVWSELAHESTETGVQHAHSRSPTLV